MFAACLLEVCCVLAACLLCACCERVTFICPLVISHELVTPKYGRAQLLPTLPRPIRVQHLNNSANKLVSVRGPKKEEKNEKKEMINIHLMTTALLSRGRGENI